MCKCLKLRKLQNDGAVSEFSVTGEKCAKKRGKIPKSTKNWRRVEAKFGNFSVEKVPLLAIMKGERRAKRRLVRRHHGAFDPGRYGLIRPVPPGNPDTPLNV